MNKDIRMRSAHQEEGIGDGNTVCVWHAGLLGVFLRFAYHNITRHFITRLVRKLC
jgi:hypothetical protein